MVSKILISLLVFLSIQLFALGQKDSHHDPENIIIVYHDDGSKEILYKNELSHDPDSINNHVVNDVLKEYTTNLDSASLTKMLIGNWDFKQAVRTNGEEIKYYVRDYFSFNSNLSLLEVLDKDTVTGSWDVSSTENGELHFYYNIKRCMITDSLMLANMSKEMIENLTYDSVKFVVSQVNDTSLKFMVSFPITNPKSHEFSTYHRIILLEYEKVK